MSFMLLSRLRGALVLILCLLYAVPALAQDVTLRVDVARDGERRLVAVRLDIPAGYHAYAHRAGDAGRPTTLKLSLDGGAALPVWYPEGTMQRDIFDPSATIFAYEGNVYLFAALPDEADAAAEDGAGQAGLSSAMPLAGGGAVSLSGGRPLPAGTEAGQNGAGGAQGGTALTYELGISLLLCSDRHCVPIDRQEKGSLPAEPWPDVSTRPWAEAWQALKGQPPVDAATDSGETMFSSAGGASDMSQSVAAFLGRGQKEAPLPAPDDFGLDLKPRYLAETFEVSGLWTAVLVGLLAGLILNAMPCVLPVLSLKISGLLLMGGGSREGLRLFRQHNICFSAGVLTLFTLLGLLLGAADMMWGQLYQSESVLLVMLLLVFLMGLSMLGVFSLPMLTLRGDARSRHPALESYLTGLIATFLATPCSGPLLGGVLAWAFTQSLLVLVVVFWSVGIGMSLPYILFAIWPRFAYVLPRPGAWMIVCQKIMGFLLLATAVYLLSILPAAKHMQVLMVLLLVSLGAWLWGQYCGITAPRRRRMLIGGLSLLILVTGVVWILRPPAPTPQWREFSATVFSEELGKKPLLLEFTADYCPNCKFLEATVLTTERLRGLRERYGVELVRVDLTAPNAYAMRLLEALGSRSIPLTALFPEGDMAQQPVVLRDVYSGAQLEEAAVRAFAP